MWPFWAFFVPSLGGFNPLINANKICLNCIIKKRHIFGIVNLYANTFLIAKMSLQLPPILFTLFAFYFFRYSNIIFAI